MDASIDGAARGALAYRETQIRVAKKIGDRARVAKLEKQPVTLRPADLGEIAKTASAEGTAFVEELEERLRQVLRNNTAKGVKYDAATIQRKLVAVLIGDQALIQPIQPSAVALAAVRPKPIQVRTARGTAIRRPMKIGNKARYEAFQKRLTQEKFERAILKDAKRPRKLIKMTPKEKASDRARIKRLGDWEKKVRADPGSKAARRGLARYQTNYTDWKNTTQVKAGLRDKDVVSFVFTLGLGVQQHTDICLSRQGLTVRRGDPRLITEKPPLHYGCKSAWIPVTKAAAKEFKITPNTRAFKNEIEDNPAQGGF